MIKKNKSTPEQIAFWKSFEDAAKKVETWPLWKQQIKVIRKN